MTHDEALQTLMEAADCWAHELVEYIAPSSEDFGDDESAQAQRDNADEIWEAIALLRGELHPDPFINPTGQHPGEDWN